MTEFPLLWYLYCIVKFQLIVVDNSGHFQKQDLRWNAMVPAEKRTHFIHIADSERKLFLNLGHFVVICFTEYELQDVVV